MLSSPKRQDSIREEADPDDNTSQASIIVPDPDRTSVMNGYSESLSSETKENGNVTVISSDSDPSLNECKTTKSVQECTTQVVQDSPESDMFLVQEESTPFCCVETVEGNSMQSSLSSISDDAGSSVAFTEAVVQDLSEESVSCAAELLQEDMEVCELVDCTESVLEEFQVAPVESDDNISVYSCNIGSSENIGQMHEIVQECEEKSMEEVPMNPVEKALIRRG